MTSRLTVEAARFIRLAISRIDESEAIPREISSRSARVRARGDRRRAAGRIPPRGSKTDRMQLCSLPKARPISCSDCPAFQRFQTSPFSIAESPNRFPGLMPTPPFQNRFISVVLHRPIECTALIRTLAVVPERILLSNRSGGADLGARTHREYKNSKPLNLIFAHCSTRACASVKEVAGACSTRHVEWEDADCLKSIALEIQP